jgi:hypothetical protein
LVLGVYLSPALDQFLRLVDALGQLDRARAGFGTLEMILAGPDPVRPVEYRKPFFQAVVA